jgi:HTH-type transcriptional regulator / antitoxin HigA
MTDPTTLSEVRDLSVPGDILEEALEERGMSNAELARRTELSEKHVSQLVNARVPLSMDVAFKLEQVLGIPANFWLSLESNYRAEQKRAAHRKQLKAYADWMRRFPVREMVRSEYITRIGSDAGARVDALLTFFGVTSEEAWSKEWKHATGRFRKSPSFEPDLYALTAWLRRGEIAAQSIRCAPFNAEQFRKSLGEARKLTTEPPDVFVPRLRDLCAASGVAFTLVPALPRLAISGVTRWLGPDKAVVSLSLRHKSDDQLWFSFFHEACHVLEHKTSAIYIDAAGETDCDEDERRANQFACDILISPHDYARLVAELPASLTEIASFAKKIGVSPGIVVGRLQHEKQLRPSHGNKLKTWFRWEFEDK